MLFSIGYGNFVESRAIVRILNPEGATVKRLRDAAGRVGMLVNATGGRKARSVIVLTTNHIVLSSLHPDTLKARLRRLIL